MTFPNGIFSGQILSAVVKNKDIKQTAEWQLLLSSIALPGVFVGAWVRSFAPSAGGFADRHAAV